MNIILENMVNKFSLVSYNWKYFPKIHENRTLEFRKKYLSTCLMQDTPMGGRWSYERFALFE